MTRVLDFADKSLDEHDLLGHVDFDEGALPVNVKGRKTWQLSCLVIGVLLMGNACSSDKVAAPTSAAPRVTANSAPPNVVDTVASTIPEPITVPATTPPTAPDTTAADPVVKRTPVKVLAPDAAGAGQATVSRRDLAAVGYTESEFFIEGSATSYAPNGALGSDGVWDVSPDGRQFVMVRPLGGGQTPTLHMILHRFDQRERRSPAAGGSP